MCFFLNLNMVRDKVRDKVEPRTPPNTFSRRRLASCQAGNTRNFSFAKRLHPVQRKLSYTLLSDNPWGISSVG